MPEKDLQDEGMITVAPIVWCDFEGPEPRMKWEKHHLLKSGTFTCFAWMLVMLGCECDIPALLFMQLRGLPTGSVVQFHTA